MEPRHEVTVPAPPQQPLEQPPPSTPPRPIPQPERGASPMSVDHTKLVIGAAETVHSASFEL